MKMMRNILPGVTILFLCTAVHSFNGAPRHLALRTHHLKLSPSFSVHGARPRTLSRVVPRASTSAVSAFPTFSPTGKVATVGSAAVYVVMDILLAKMFARFAIPFPSALAGMVGLFAALVGLHSAKGTKASGRALAVLSPGAALFAKWLPLFFVPSLVVLPLFPAPAGSDSLKLVALVVGGWALSVWSTGLLIETLSSLAGRGDQTKEPASLSFAGLRSRVNLTRFYPSVGDIGGEISAQKRAGAEDPASYLLPPAAAPPPSSSSSTSLTATSPPPAHLVAFSKPPPPPFSLRVQRTLALATAATGAATVLLAKTGTAPASAAAAAATSGGGLSPLLQATSSLFALSASAFAFVTGSRASPSFKKVLHPVLVTVGATWGAFQLLAALAGSAPGHPLSFLGLVQSYITKTPTLPGIGAGDVLLFFLGPSILSFSVNMFRERTVMKQRSLEVAGATLGASLSGLFLSAALARVLNLSPLLRLPTVSRQLTSPLAMAVADVFSAEKSLAVALVVVTGLLGSNFGRSLMDTLGYRSPVTRGLTMGATAHGLGTASLAASEPDAFAFSAIAMALVGATTTALVTIPFVRTAVAAVAGV